MALAPAANLSIAIIFAVIGQLLYGFAMGIEGPLEKMGYRQFVTPSHLQGRMNATLRSINRSAVVIGAPLGGAIADGIGFLTSLWISIAGLALCGLCLVQSFVNEKSSNKRTRNLKNAFK